jgi:hypothetical protein
LAAGKKAVLIMGRLLPLGGSLIRICIAALCLSFVFCCQSYCDEPVELHSSSWERKASLEALKRYLKFCKQNGQRLEKELDSFPPVKSDLSDELKNNTKTAPLLSFLNPSTKKHQNILH